MTRWLIEVIVETRVEVEVEHEFSDEAASLACAKAAHEMGQLREYGRSFRASRIVSESTVGGPRDAR